MIWQILTPDYELVVVVEEVVVAVAVDVAAAVVVVAVVAVVVAVMDVACWGGQGPRNTHGTGFTNSTFTM